MPSWNELTVEHLTWQISHDRADIDDLNCYKMSTMPGISIVSSHSSHRDLRWPMSMPSMLATLPFQLDIAYICLAVE